MKGRYLQYVMQGSRQKKCKENESEIFSSEMLEIK